MDYGRHFLTTSLFYFLEPQFSYLYQENNTYYTYLWELLGSIMKCLVWSLAHSFICLPNIYCIIWWARCYTRVENAMMNKPTLGRAWKGLILIHLTNIIKHLSEYLGVLFKALKKQSLLFVPSEHLGFGIREELE